MNTDDNTISAPILEMLTVANEYCFFLEHAEEKNKDQVLVFMQRILPLLYLKGSLLPTLEPEFPEASERFVTEENWESIFNPLRKILDKDDEFWVIDPLYINETEPINSSGHERLSPAVSTQHPCCTRKCCERLRKTICHPLGISYWQHPRTHSLPPAQRFGNGSRILKYTQY